MTLTVDEAVDMALKNNLDVRQAERDVAVAQANLREAWAAMLMPTFQLTGSYSYTDQIQSTFAYPYNDNYSAGLQVSRTLFNGGRFWYSKENARYSAQLADFKLRDRRKAVVRTTRINFYNLLVLRDLLRLAQANDRYLKEHLDSTRVNFKNGLASQLDLLQDEVKYQNNKPLLNQAENNYEVAKLSFALTIGLPAGRSVEPSGEVADSAAIQPLSTDEGTVVASALTLDPGVQTAEYQILINQAAAAAYAALRLPSIAGNFNYAFSTRVTAPGSDRVFTPGWSFSFSAVIPLDAWIPYASVVSNQIMSADELTAKLRLAKEAAVNALRIKVRTLLLNIKYARANIEGQRENVAQAKLALDGAEKQYSEGNLSSLALTDAEVSYNQATVNYLQALAAGYSNVLELNDLVK